VSFSAALFIYLVQVLPFPAPFTPLRTVLLVVVVLATIIWLGDSIGLFSGHAPRLR
jgi:hypothetical protein